MVAKWSWKGPGKVWNVNNKGVTFWKISFSWTRINQNFNLSRKAEGMLPFSIPMHIWSNTLHFQKRIISNIYIWVIENSLKTLCSFIQRNTECVLLRSSLARCLCCQWHSCYSWYLYRELLIHCLSLIFVIHINWSFRYTKVKKWLLPLSSIKKFSTQKNIPFYKNCKYILEKIFYMHSHLPFSHFPPFSLKPANIISNLFLWLHKKSEMKWENGFLILLRNMY